MKIPPKFRPALIALTFGLTAPASVAQAEYAGLIEALQTKNREAASTFKEANLLMKGYQDYLDDPEVEVGEKPALRKAYLKEKARVTQSQTDFKRTKGAIRSLVHLQKNGSVDPKVFKDSYQGLEALARKGTGAWKEVLAEREQLQADLRREYQTKLLAAETQLHGLETRENVSKRLLDAVDSRSGGLNDDQFKTALKLPPLITATASGFGIGYQGDDKEHHAQLVLFALTGYANYFREHFDDGDSAGEKEPVDRHRNIFGVADGRVLLSDAISHHESNFYHLSDDARERFNTRVAGIWGSEGLQVKTWNQRYSESFGQACRKLSPSSEDGRALPNETIRLLIKEIDGMLAADKEARQAVEMIHSEYELKLSQAEAFGENVWLSTAAYNAGIWANESKELLSDFERAGTRLARQAELCLQQDWKPDTQGIQASVRIINRATQRYPLVAKVRRDLEGYFGKEDQTKEVEKVGLSPNEVEALEEDRLENDLPLQGAKPGVKDLPDTKKEIPATDLLP